MCKEIDNKKPMLNLTKREVHRVMGWFEVAELDPNFMRNGGQEQKLYDKMQKVYWEGL